MGLLSLILILVVAALLVFVWRRFAYETVVLEDAHARRQSAAQWMAEGEVEAAEEMLRAAVDALDGWPKAVAQGDLASLFMASDRDALAMEALQSALQAVPETAEEREEMLELRIRMARLLVGDDQVQKAEDTLRAALPPNEESIFSALAAEALGEFYVQEGRSLEAVATLRPALDQLVAHGHDRAAPASVSLAYASFDADRELPWACLDELPDDLLSAAVVNLCDRVGGFRAELREVMLRSLLAHLGDSPGLETERAHLEAMLKSVGQDG